MRISKIYFNQKNIKNSNQIEPENITIVVGPNNSGKSQLLRDIDNWCWNYTDKLKIISSIDLDLPSDRKSVETLFDEFKINKTKGTTNNPDIINVRPPYTPVNKSYDSFNLKLFAEHFSERRIDQIKNSNINLINYFVKLLDGKARFQLIDDAPIGNLHSFPQNCLDNLFRKDKIREELREIIYKEFGKYFYVSPMSGTVLKIVLSDIPNLKERNLSDSMIEQFSSSESLNEFGGGIKCFIGILITAWSYNYRILLIDEPEAFLLSISIITLIVCSQIQFS